MKNSEKKLSVEDIKKVAEKAGFIFESRSETGHYVKRTKSEWSVVGKFIGYDEDGYFESSFDGNCEMVEDLETVERIINSLS